jgi:hypothetical protein
MYPICGRKLMTKNKLLPLVLAIAASTFLLGTTVSAHAAAKKSAKATEIEAPIAGVVTVSDYEFNTFVFPGTIKRVFFPSGAPVSGKPIYLAENTQVMLQFNKSEKPAQMVAELDGGSVVTLRVLPRSVPGIVHAVNGARAKSPSARKATTDPKQQAAARGEDIELLKQLMIRHEPPDDFEPIKLPNPVRFDKFSVVPLASWSNGASKRIHIFSLVAVPGQTAVVAPPQFYRDGINAVMLDGDVVDDTTAPQLFIVEEFADE